jgi:chemotaxis protein CheD
MSAAVETALEKRYVQPGQIFVTTRPTLITTILGSCVSVCMWDPEKRVGGMNHFMLPLVAGGSIHSPRFGKVAMEELITQLQANGARLTRLHAHVFGGACMFQQMQTKGHLGHKNVEFALDYLARTPIEVEKVDVGGTRGRKLHFQTDEGTTWLSSI